MIIRSQDKKEIHNLDTIKMIKIVSDSKEYFVQVNSQHTIGVYSTEEKAIKVLDMIQATYEKNKLFAITYKDGVLQRLEKRNGLEGTRELIGSVFQMPSDAEVEV